jgi:hypothetical protein
LYVILVLCFWMEDFLIAWYFWYGGVGKEMAWQPIMIDTEHRHKSISFSMSSIVFFTCYYIHKDSLWHIRIVIGSRILHYLLEYLKLRILLLKEWITIYYLQCFFEKNSLNLRFYFYLVREEGGSVTGGNFERQMEARNSVHCNIIKTMLETIRNAQISLLKLRQC